MNCKVEKAEEFIETKYNNLLKKKKGKDFILEVNPRWMADFSKYIFSKKRIVTKQLKPRPDGKNGYFISALLTEFGVLIMQPNFKLKDNFKFVEIKK